MSTPKFAETHNLVAFLEKPTESEGFEKIIDFLNDNAVKYALMVNPTIYTICIKQFWATAKVKTVNGEKQIQALVDKKKVIITETSVRTDLHLEDAKGTECLPTATIFEQLTLMGQVEGMLKHEEIYVTPSHTKKIFANKKRQGKDFSVKKHKSKKSKKRITEVPQPSDSTNNATDEHVTTTSNDSLLSGEDRLKLIELMELCTQLQLRFLALENTKADQALEIGCLKRRGEGSTVLVESHQTPSGAPTTSQPPLSSPSGIPNRQETKVPQPSSPTHTHVADEAASTSVDVRHGGAATTVTGLDSGQGSGNIDKTPSMPRDLPLSRVNILGSDEGSMTINELKVLCIKLSQKVDSLEADLKLQEQLDEEERQRIARVHEEASSFNVEEWEDIQDTIEADEMLALRIQSEEREKYSEAEKQRLFLWDLVKKRFSTKEPIDDKEKELWVELKRLFEPDVDDTLWKLQSFYCWIQEFLLLVEETTAGRHHNIHQRSGSPLNLAEDDLSLGNLKFVPKGKIDETKQAKPAPAKQPKPKPVKEKSTKPKPTSPQKARKGKVTKAQTGQAHVGGVAIQELVAEATRPLHVVKGNGKAIAIEEQVAQSLLALHTPKRRSTTDQFIFQRQTPATEEASTRPSAQPQDDTSANIVRETPSPANAKTGTDTDKVITEGDTKILNINEEQEEDVDNKVSLMKNKPKMNRENRIWMPKFVSMVNVLIHQASTSVPPLSTPIIDLLPLKLVDFPRLEPLSATTTKTTTTTLPLPPPQQQQSTTDSELAARVTTLEKKFFDFEQKSQTLDKGTQNLGSMVFTLELRDLPHKINQTVNEVVKEASGSYKSLPEHVALYQALEASMELENRDELVTKKDKSQKRRRDDQYPPPLPDSDLSKKKRHDSDASGSKQPPAPKSSTWKTSDTKEAPFSSSNQQFAPHSEQPVEDVPIQNDVNISDSEDTDTSHLPKIKTRPDWLKPVPEEYIPETPEPDWIIPLTDLPKAENNWADALAKSYKDPEENKL
nr:hypothetical protein [Tanacetum cinerariifolium]